MFKLCSCFKGKSQIKENELNLKITGEYAFILSGDDQSGRRKVIESLVNQYDPFTRPDKILKIGQIEEYIRYSLIEILRRFLELNPPIEVENIENEHKIEYLLRKLLSDQFEFTNEIFDYFQSVYNDSGFQRFLNQTNEFYFDDTQIYFLQRLNDIRNPDYLPTTQDMICSRLFPSNIFENSFDIKKEKIRLNVVEIGTLNKENEDQIESCVNQSNTIIYLVDLTSFEQIIDQKEKKSRFDQSIQLFTNFQQNPFFSPMSIILIFTKEDILQKKLRDGLQLKDYFPDFNHYVYQDDGIKSNEENEFIRAKHFLKDQFLKLTSKKCSIHFTSEKDLNLNLISNQLKIHNRGIHLQNYARIH